MKCRNCGKEVNEDWNLCPFCEATLKDTLVCTGCGNQLQPEWSLCPFCGTKVETLSQSTPNVDDTNILPDLDDADLVNTVIEEVKNTEYQKKLDYALVACIRKKYDEAQQIYDSLIKENPFDMNAYIGYIRIASKNFTIFESGEIEETIRVAKEISAKNDSSKYDVDYENYITRRNKYLEEKERQVVMRMEDLRKLKEEIERKAREEVEYKNKLSLARTKCIEEDYKEAKNIYKELLKNDEKDINAIIGFVRIESKNYTQYQGSNIEKAILKVEQIHQEAKNYKLDNEYQEYLSKRKAELDRIKMEEARRIASEEAERKMKEEIARKVLERKERNPRREGNYVYIGMWPKSAKLSDVKINDKQDENGYYLGSDGELYEEVNHRYFKVEPIKWQILSENNGKILLLTDEIIDFRKFDKKSNNYKLSEIRDWMNYTFYYKAFTYKERTYIKQAKVDNSEAGTERQSSPFACEDTFDNIFLLSYVEAYSTYGLRDIHRNKMRTAYALEHGSYSTSGWWLRSPNSYSDNRVSIFDTLGHNLDPKVDELYGVVLAMQIWL